MYRNYNELVVFIVRETGWTLEYIGHIKFAKLQVLAEELQHQKDIDDYNRNRVVALLVTCWAKDAKLEDIIGLPPVRQGEEVQDIWLLAEEAGIKIPSKRA